MENPSDLEYLLNFLVEVEKLSTGLSDTEWQEELVYATQHYNQAFETAFNLAEVMQTYDRYVHRNSLGNRNHNIAKDSKISGSCA